MHKFSLLLLFPLLLLSAETNSSEGNQSKTETNSSINKNLQKAIELEQKYKKEQKFYQGEEYNLSEHKVDESTVEKVPLIEPEYDFDITDLYNDQ